uniref:Triokinase/FMN cyclase n=1 Tax=Panagrellus redivivus TaxID=6233 RepID=A0A7E4VD55_PANRE
MPEAVVNKFINHPEETVIDGLKGLVLGNEELKLHPHNWRVVLRAKQPENAVALIAGGGSGHEPYAAGFVGTNGLTGAVSGDVFASPSSEAVFNALQAVTKKEGTIVYVINYTGDRLNFGMAVERFKAISKQQNVDLVYIDDDVSLEAKTNTVGGRGLAGAATLFQIVGYLAEVKNVKFDELLETSRKIVANSGTFGVSLKPCAIPGKPRMFELDADKMELGLGIHGEPGCERTKIAEAKSVVATALERLTKSKRLQLTKDDDYIVLLNNLGATSQIELGILEGETLKWLAENGFKNIKKFAVGTVMTSIDAHGISLTIVKVQDKAWVDAFDHHSSVSSHLQISTPVLNLDRLNFQKEADESDVQTLGKSIPKETAKSFEAAIKAAADAIEKKEDLLNKLDGCGDGDCGTTLKTAAKAVKQSLSDGKVDFEHPQTALTQIARIFEKSVGGTTGAIYAMFFTAGSVLYEQSTDAATFHEALKRGLDAIMKYGHAKPGHRTLVDPLHAAAEAVNSPKGESDWKTVVEAIEKAAEDTAKMEAKSGRASYTNAEEQHRPDPGAIAVATFAKAAFDAFYGHK